MRTTSCTGRDGGATSLANPCSLCRRHHRLVHEHGYRIVTTGDGALRFFRSDGTAALRVAHAKLGFDIDAATAAPRWDGAPVDYGLAVQRCSQPHPLDGRRADAAVRRRSGS